MLKGKKVFVGTVMTNVVENKYWPISQYSLQAMSDIDFVDEVLVVDGCSTDDTVEKHSKISSKVKILKGPYWNTEDFSAENWERMRGFLYDYCHTLNEDCILIFQCADVFYTNAYTLECKNVIEKMIDERSDFCVPPVLKVLSPWFGLMYNSNVWDQEWYELGITQFFKGESIWREDWVHKANHRNASRPMKKMIHPWETRYNVYETWFFDKDQFSKKIKYHSNWDSKMSIDEAILKMYYWKISQYKNANLSLSDHPKEAMKILKSLEEHHLGFSLFGHIQPQMKFEDFKKVVSGY